MLEGGFLFLNEAVLAKVNGLDLLELCHELCEEGKTAEILAIEVQLETFSV